MKLILIVNIQVTTARTRIYTYYQIKLLLHSVRTRTFNLTEMFYLTVMFIILLCSSISFITHAHALCVCACIRACMYTCMCAYTCVYICLCVCAYTCLRVMCTHNTCACICVCVCVCTRAFNNTPLPPGIYHNAPKIPLFPWLCRGCSSTHHFHLENKLFFSVRGYVLYPCPFTKKIAPVQTRAIWPSTTTERVAA